MSGSPQFVDFTVTDRGPALAVMRAVAEKGDGWINFAPSLEIEDVPEPPTMFQRVFAASGPKIPFGTWVPGDQRKNSVTRGSLGLRHGFGPKAIIGLRETGVTVPDGWRVLSDHGRRGLVLSLPGDVEPELALDWLLRAAVPLSPMELPPEWKAQVYRTNS